MQVLKNSDSVSLVFGEWFDKTYGNSYYDVELWVNDKVYYLPFQYGYNASDKQSIDDALKFAGYRVRNNKSNIHKPYKNLRISKVAKLKRELFK